MDGHSAAPVAADRAAGYRGPVSTVSDPRLRSDLGQRLTAARHRLRIGGLDALLVTPGPDLRYLTGYDAVPLERLTCLVVRAADDPVLLVPELERLAALASPVADLGVDLATWSETEDPYAPVAGLLAGARVVAVDDRMWAQKVLALRDALPSARQIAGGSVLSPMRAVKSAAEIAALSRAGAAIDAVHHRVPQFLRAGRTEREVARDIAEAMLDAGHTRVDFVIVGSGPNGASPHHEVSDRVIGGHEPIVIDIGGTMPDGYCSDSTRMYCVGEPPAGFTDYFAVLRIAQEAQVAAVRPGMTCADLDAVGRNIIAAAGFGDRFIHRTGHGIGLETHEDPYIVAGNATVLEPGHTFSIEPGIYVEGLHGARIEDIVACSADGALRLNTTDRDLVVL